MGFLRLGLAVGLLSLNGCSAVLREVRYPGGYPGYLLDKRTFDASENKRLQLLRGALVLAMAARIGEGAVRGEDGDGFARQLANASAEINHAAANLGMGDLKSCTVGDDKPLPPIAAGVISARKMSERATAAAAGVVPIVTAPVGTVANESASLPPAPDIGCAGYYVNFETDVARLESRTIRAMVAALPTDRARRFLEDVAKGDVLSAAWSALSAAGDIAGSFHRASGVYRSGLETVAATMDAPCSIKQLGTEPTMTVLGAADCLGLDRDNLFDDEDAKGKDLKQVIPNRSFHAILRIVRESCVALPLSNELDEIALTASRELRRKACAAIIFLPVPRSERVELEVQAIRTTLTPP